jgi:hypothetical protein
MWKYNSRSHQLFIDFEMAYDAARREVFYSFLIEICIRMKLVRLIKIILIDIYNKDKGKVLVLN